jgi:hypothetical protein
LQELGLIVYEKDPRYSHEVYQMAKGRSPGL